MLDTACQSFYWLRLNKQTLKKYEACDVCHEVSWRDYQTEPLSDNTETNILPIVSLSLDWGEFGRHKFLVVVNRASIYIWASILDSMFIL